MELNDKDRLVALERRFDVLESENKGLNRDFTEFRHNYKVDNESIRRDNQERDKMLQNVCREQAEDRVELKYIRKGQEELQSGQQAILHAVNKTKYPPAAKLAFAGVVLMTVADILMKVWK